MSQVATEQMQKPSPEEQQPEKTEGKENDETQGLSSLLPLHLFKNRQFILPTNNKPIAKKPGNTEGGVLQESGMTVIKSKDDVEQIDSNKAGAQPNMYQLYNSDNAKLGKDTTQESYNRVRIEDFGKSVLQNLGWEQDNKLPLGRNPKASDYIEPDFKNLIPRQGRLGLGAKPMTDDQIRKLKRNGDNNHLKINDRQEKEKNDTSLYVGCSVQIIDGSHKGLSGKVIKFDRQQATNSQLFRDPEKDQSSEDRNQYVSVELSKSGAVVNVKRKRLMREGLWSGLGKRKNQEEQAQPKMGENGKRQKTSNEIDMKSDEGKEATKIIKEARPLRWVKEGLVVRIISSKYMDGKMYSKKVRVQTIMNDTQFLATDYTQQSTVSAKVGSTVYEGLTEKDLETVLPPSSEFQKSYVMVLKGEFKQELGHILQKNKEKQKVTVQLNEDAGKQIIELSMDDVCLFQQRE